MAKRIFRDVTDYPPYRNLVPEIQGFANLEGWLEGFIYGRWLPLDVQHALVHFVFRKVAFEGKDFVNAVFTTLFKWRAISSFVSNKRKINTFVLTKWLRRKAIPQRNF